MDIRNQVKSKLEMEGRKLNWLAAQLDITQSHASQILSFKRPFSKNSLIKLIELWPDLDLSETPDPLPHEQLAIDRESIKETPLFKDE